MQQKTITTTLLFIFPFRRTIGQIAQRVRVYYTTTHTNKRVGIYCVVRHCLVGKRFIIPLLNQQQKAKAEEEEEEAIGVVDVSGLLELFLYVFKAMACCLADVPPRIYTGMYSSSSRRREAVYCIPFSTCGRAVVAFLNDVIHYTIPSECCCCLLDDVRPLYNALH